MSTSNPTHKVVLLPIEVPVGLHCWNRQDGLLCRHFDNEGGHPTCEMGFYPLVDDNVTGVAKPPACAQLADAPPGVKKHL